MAADYLIDHILRALAEAGPAPGAAEPSLAAQLVNAFRLPDGAPDVLRCAELLADGRGPAEDLLAEALRRAGGTDAGPARAVPGSAVTELIGWDLRLTGAEAVAILLRSAGVTTVFGYPGTSELALCDAVDRADGIRLVNGRGDKES